MIEIIYDEATDITASVVIEDCSFTSSVNGSPGPCLVKVRDPLRNKTFVTGRRLTLDIDGDRTWSGYITAVKRAYAFDDSSPMTRYLILEGSDINILLHRRFVFSQATPTKMLGPSYAAATADTTTIAALVADWLDLSGDDLDTSSLVDNVGNVNVDQKANLWQAGWEWVSAMATIARLTQAIFYIDPNRNLVYVDVDTPTAAVGLTDNPGGEGVGYRELEVLHDGANLINDALIWGYGGGSPTPVFKRLESSSSQTTHGRWQFGESYAGLWKQATADKVADSIINGSPLSKRGGKNDRISVSLTTFTSGFLPAQKVSFYSHAHGFSDVIPIRRMEITFPGGNPKYRLTLSHEIDQPFNLIDIIPLPRINFNLPPLGGWSPPEVEIPGTDCDVSVCGITDTFTRTESGGWGTSDVGFAWFNVTGSSQSVDGSRGIIPQGTAVAMGFPLSETIDFQFTFEFSSASGRLLAVASGDTSVEFYADLDQIDINRESATSNTETTSFSFTSGVIYHARIVDGPTETTATVWVDGDPEPGSPTLVNSSPTYPSEESLAGPGFRAVAGTVYIDNLDTGLDRCTESRFDNFNRTVSNGWGTSDFGTTWTTAGTSSVWSVNGTQGRLSGSGTAWNMILSDPTGPWLNDEFTFTSRFKTGDLFAGGTGQWHIQLTDFDSTGDRDCFISFFNGTNHSFIEIDNGTGTGAATVTFLSNTWYNLSLYYNRTTGELAVKIWKMGTAEPGSPTAYKISGGDDPLGPSPDFRFICRSFAGTFNLTWEWLDFDYDGKPCYIGGPTAGDPVPTTSPANHICTVLATDGSQTVFIVQGGYEAGSLEVYLDGLRQTYGSDYTETTPGEGVFTMTSAPAGADELYVCYHYINPSGGGGGRPPLLL